MTAQQKLDLFYMLFPYLLALISALIAWAKSRYQVPKRIQAFLKDADVMAAIKRGVKVAQDLQGKTNEEKREYARRMALEELADLGKTAILDQDATVNYLIEQVIVNSKGA